jgi:hypothetical protein
MKPKLAKRGRPSRVSTTPSSSINRATRSNTSDTRRGTTSLNAIAGITSSATNFTVISTSSDDDDEMKYDDTTIGVITGTDRSSISSGGTSSSISTTTITGTHRPVNREASSSSATTTTATGMVLPPFHFFCNFCLGCLSLLPLPLLLAVLARNLAMPLH